MAFNLLAQRKTVGVYLLTVLLYASLAFTLPNEWLVPALLGLLIGAMLPSKKAVAVGTLAWVSCAALSRGKMLLFTPYYFEGPYAELLAQRHAFSLPHFLAAGMEGLVFLLLSTRVRWTSKRRGQLATALLAIICLSQMTLVVQLGFKLPRTFATDPPDQSYFSDDLMVIKLLHNYQQGHNYWESFRLSMETDGRTYQPGYPGTSLRPPTLFWLLLQLPQLGQVPLLFWGATLLLQILIFFASRRYLAPLPSLLGPSLVGAYLLYGNSTTFMILCDFPGGIITAMAVAFEILLGWIPAVILLTVGATIREWVGSFLLFFLLQSLHQRSKIRSLVGLGMLAFDGMLYWVNNNNCRDIVGKTAALNISSRLNGSLESALAALRHGSVFILQGQILLPFLAIFSLLALARFRRESSIYLLIVPTWIVWLSFLRLGGSATQYYGFSVAPLFLWAGALGIGSIVPLEEPEEVTDPLAEE